MHLEWVEMDYMVINELAEHNEVVAKHSCMPSYHLVLKSTFKVVLGDANDFFEVANVKGVVQGVGGVVSLLTSTTWSTILFRR
jgi:hypothetical protein